jgi:predicted ATPase
MVDLRSFRGRRVLDFVDPATGEARDRVVLVGSNGSGKTTVLELVEGLLAFVWNGNVPDAFSAAGLAKLTLELHPTESGDERPIEVTIAVGKKAHAPDWESWNNPLVYLRESGKGGRPITSASAAVIAARAHIAEMLTGNVDLSGGAVFFPHSRNLARTGKIAIAPPPSDRLWVARYGDQWAQSLEQLWVWRNYLDLEARERGESSDLLLSSIQFLRAVLGPGRPVEVREGRIRIAARPDSSDSEPDMVSLDALPSGERQCVILMGEIERRKRSHAVLMIDEPEISLHPALQRQLLGQLRRIAKLLDLQVILATHSQEIVRAMPSSDVVSLDYPSARFDAEGCDPESKKQ